MPLLGLYQGVPLTRRGAFYRGVPPTRSRSTAAPWNGCTAPRGRLRQEIRRVVLHEVAHHFGISDERLVGSTGTEVIFRRSGRFDDLVRRQFALLADDEADLLAEAESAEDAWTRAGRDEAEERYGDYQLVVDAIADRLLDVRETYASTLAEDAVDEYRDAFTCVATKRFPRYASLLA